MALIDQIEASLLNAGYEVLVDDRNERVFLRSFRLLSVHLRFLQLLVVYTLLYLPYLLVARYTLYPLDPETAVLIMVGALAQRVVILAADVLGGAGLGDAVAQLKHLAWNKQSKSAYQNLISLKIKRW